MAVPNVGYFKISFQSYIAPGFETPTPKAYIHLAFTPLQGPTTKYDLFLDEVILTHPDDPNKFYYEVPGLIIADEEGIDINHDAFKFTLNWNGEHHHYWPGLNPGQTPFGSIPELPGVGGKWFLYTVGTPINYSFTDESQQLSGRGYAQLDKG
ncbi:hypothetical protein [Shewanella surugensis]|uniref:Uncharacterized protein n=1 Tax=Shewanella surugensis TaxID=212020 RepID=A0ABT0LFV7_9GAMM|nr:hypothetical protein [Shewanella surugensis]MCL1126222.1 hypothetical protein [Shewanella surugensis]